MFATGAGHRLLGRIKSIDGTVIRVIDDALEDWLFHERGIYIDGRQRPKVSAAGDVAIDVADALRRLEGPAGNPIGISAWVDAGAVEMIGKKVSLASVDATAAAISELRCSDFDDGLTAEEWSTRFLYNENYKRADALRDILSGEIRVRRDPAEERAGLASVQVCRWDFERRVRAATVAARNFKQAPSQRAERARRRDAFYRSGKVYALLEELWPGRPIPDIAVHPRVRCKTKTWKYHDRDMKQNFYSIADALELLESRRV